MSLKSKTKENGTTIKPNKLHVPNTKNVFKWWCKAGLCSLWTMLENHYKILVGDSRFHRAALSSINIYLPPINWLGFAYAQLMYLVRLPPELCIGRIQVFSLRIHILTGSVSYFQRVAFILEWIIYDLHLLPSVYFLQKVLTSCLHFNFSTLRTTNSCSSNVRFHWISCSFTFQKGLISVLIIKNWLVLSALKKKPYKEIHHKQLYHIQ